MLSGSWDCESSNDEAVVPAAPEPIVARCPEPIVFPLPLVLRDTDPDARALRQDDFLAMVASECQRRTEQDFSLAIVPAATSTTFNQFLARALVDNAGNDVPSYVRFFKFIEGRGGPFRSLPTQDAIATILELKSHSRIREKIETVAAMHHFGQRVWVESLFSNLATGARLNVFAIRSTWVFFSSDCTVLPVGETIWPTQHRLPDIPEECMVAYSPPSSEPTRTTEKRPDLKISQSALEFVVVMELSRGRRVALVVPVVCPLQATDSGAAEALYACWKESLAWPAFRELCQESDARHEYFSMDRDAANIKGDREVADECPANTDHHRSGCYSHMTFTIASLMFMAFAGLISGIVALSLSTRPGGHWRSFRECFMCVVRASTVVVQGSRPRADHPALRFRDRFLQKFVFANPEHPTKKELKQMAGLQRLVQSDITSEKIFIFTSDPDRSNDAMRVSLFSMELLDHALPARFSGLKKQRWLTGTEPIRQMALCGGLWNALQRTLVLYCSRQKKKPDAPISVRAEPWADLVEEDFERELPEEPKMTLKLDGTPDWTEWNKQQVRSVERFADTCPTGALIITSVAAHPITGLADYFVWVHSDEYARRQMESFATGGRYVTIGEELASRAGLNAFYDDIDKCMWGETSWAELPPPYHTYQHRGLASGIVSRCLCGVEFFIASDMERMPHFIDKLLLDIPGIADQILDWPPCRHTKVSENFVKRWPTKEKMESTECSQEVFIKNWRHNRSGQKLESRMASIRSVVHQRQQTHRKPFVTINSEWEIHQQRVNEADSNVTGDHRKPVARGVLAEPKRVSCGKFQGRRTGGGGKRRASVGPQLHKLYAQRDKSIKLSKDERSDILKTAHAMAEEEENVDRETWKNLGAAGTVSHRTGSKSFGKRYRPWVGRTPAKAVEDFAFRAPAPERFDAFPAGEPASSHTALVAASSEMQTRSAEQSIIDLSKAAADERKAKEKERQHVLNEWAATRAVREYLPDAEEILPNLDLASVWPVSDSSRSLLVIKYAPPVTAMTSKLLQTKETEAVHGLKECAFLAWRERCTGFREADCRRLTTQPKTPSICEVALRCMCQTPAGRDLMRFVRGISRGILQMIAKGTLGRKLYETARAVVRTYHKDKDPSEQDYWYHLGYGNLSTGLFYVLRLVPFARTIFQRPLADESAAQVIHLQAVRPTKAQHLWDTYEGVSIDRDINIELWMTVSNVEKCTPAFLPAYFSIRRAAEPSIFQKAWRPFPKKLLPLPRASAHGAGGATPAPPPITEDPRVWVMDDIIDCPTADPYPPNLVTETVVQASRAVRMMHGKAGAGGGGGLRPPEAPPDFTWDWGGDTSESSGEGDPVDDGIADPPPLSAPEPRVVERGPEFGLGGPWDKIETEIAVFILNPHNGSIGCHCTWHKNCYANKVGRFQPIGYFLAWLLDAPECATAAKHMERKKWVKTTVCYENRSIGRIVAQDDPAFTRLFEWETPKRGNEPHKLR